MQPCGKILAEIATVLSMFIVLFQQELDHFAMRDELMLVVCHFQNLYFKPSLPTEICIIKLFANIYIFIYVYEYILGP